MGVKELWSLLSPTGELLKLLSLSNNTFAIDLSGWICDSQTGSMKHVLTRPHIRNLLFRIISLLKSGILPVFVLEGNAPEIKWNTIENRLNRDNGIKYSKVKSGKRSRLKALINQCCELFNLLGLPWIQASGEAEATCAALNYHKIVDGVITQDSDAFLYGTNTVYRNFSGNKQKLTVEQFKMDDIREKLNLDRNSLIVLALLLGCDYLPAGIPGVGKEAALKLFAKWKENGVSDSLEKFLSWKLDSPILDNNCKKNIEEQIKKKALNTPGFPFNGIIEEFITKLDKPHLNISWQKPHLEKLVKWLMRMLEWEGCYAFEKASPIASLWILKNPHPMSSHSLKLKKVIKKRVQRGENSYQLEWEVPEYVKRGIEADNIPDVMITIEEASLVQNTFMDKVEMFEEEIANRKKDKKKTARRAKTKKDDQNKNIPLNVYPNFTNFRTNSEPISDDSDSDDLSFVVDRFISMRINNDQLSKSGESNSLGKVSDGISTSLEPMKESPICVIISDSDGESPFDKKLSFNRNIDFKREGNSPEVDDFNKQGDFSCSGGDISKDIFEESCIKEFPEVIHTSINNTIHSIDNDERPKQESTTSDESFKLCFKLFDNFSILEDDHISPCSLVNTESITKEASEVPVPCVPSPLTLKQGEQYLNTCSFKNPEVQDDPLTGKFFKSTKKIDLTTVIDSPLLSSSPQLSLRERLAEKYGTQFTSLLTRNNF